MVPAHSSTQPKLCSYVRVAERPGGSFVVGQSQARSQAVEPGTEGLASQPHGFLNKMGTCLPFLGFLSYKRVIR